MAALSREREVVADPVLSGGSAARRRPVAVADRAMWSRIALLAPAVVLLLGVFLLPGTLLIQMSLHPASERPYAPGYTLGNYIRVHTDPVFVRILLRTVRLASVVTVLCVAVGVPYSYLLWVSRGWRRTVLLLGMLLPLFTNVIARIYGWQILLSNSGPINRVLVALGLTDQPLRLSYSFFGAAVGLVYVALPYFSLTYQSALAGLDPTLLQAARSLGANPVRAFREVVLPLTSPGLATATSIAFAWGMGAYAETLALGSPREWGLGYEAWRQWFLVRDWPMSSVLSVVMVGVTLAIIVLTHLRMTRVRGVTAR
jgi:putative spermidine/putrescine transport system permease protein